jgi:hypothetical protein
MYKVWTLTKAPFECRSSILEEIGFRLTDDGYISVYDTANDTGGTFTIKDHILTVDYDGMWTQKGRVWRTEKEYQEAERADLFIHQLIANPFEFKYDNDILIVLYNNEEYYFK